MNTVDTNPVVSKALHGYGFTRGVSKTGTGSLCTVSRFGQRAQTAPVNRGSRLCTGMDGSQVKGPKVSAFTRFDSILTFVFSPTCPVMASSPQAQRQRHQRQWPMGHAILMTPADVQGGRRVSTTAKRQVSSLESGCGDDDDDTRTDDRQRTVDGRSTDDDGRQERRLVNR